jgi:hypothetical protein
MDRKQPDAEIHFHGTGGVWIKLISSRAIQDHFEGCPDDLRPYFYFRRYGDTPFGWYGCVADDLFWESARMLVVHRGLAVDALDLTLDPRDEGFRRRLTADDLPAPLTAVERRRAVRQEGP